MNKKWLAGPYLVWMIGFIIIPLGLIVFYGLTDRTGAFTLKNLLSIATPEHLKALGLSLALSLISTLICLVLAYPLAMILRNRGMGQGSFIVFIFILPMWMNFLLRTLAWQTLLEKNGVINGILNLLHLPPQSLINTPGAIVLGMVYNFLPFMILPIYTMLMKLDPSYIEAAGDRGANGVTTFFKVILPLSLPGIISGLTMVFLPSTTTFAISQLLGGGMTMLYGDLIYMKFITEQSWSAGSALSIVLLAFVLLSMGMMRHFDKDSSGEKGGVRKW